MRVFVVSDSPLDVAFQAVDGQVHLGEADRGGVLLQTPEGELLSWAFMLTIDEAGVLYEHTARTAGRVSIASIFSSCGIFTL